MSSSGEETYEVEEIRDKRRSLKNLGGVEYYVKWVGWDSDTNTWEPPEHLESCMGLVEQFEKKLARRKERREIKRKEEIQKREEKHQRRKEREIANVDKLKAADSSDSDEPVKKDEGRDMNHNLVKVKNNSSGPAHDEKSKVKVKKSQKLFTEDSDSDSAQTKNKGKYFKDLTPVRIVGLTKDPPLPGLHFCIEFKKVEEKGSPSDIGLIAVKEAYEKIPQMCLQFYEKHLVWNEKGSSASAL